jgi:hypothetical protein
MSRYSQSSNPGAIFQEILFRRAVLFGGLILLALLAFEVFNYSTTEFALNDVLGDLRFLGVRWATILAIAFCCIDFAGVARLFTPERGADEPAEVWYLFGAWLLAAGMNALLTWWGVSVAIANHQSLGGAVIPQPTLLKVVPVFVAVMVWLTRVLIIGTFAVAGERLFGMLAVRHQRSPQPEMVIPAVKPAVKANRSRPVVTPRNQVQPVSFGRTINTNNVANVIKSINQSSYNPAPKPPPSEPEPTYSRPEPTYHPVAAGQASHGNTATRR